MFVCVSRKIVTSLNGVKMMFEMCSKAGLYLLMMMSTMMIKMIAGQVPKEVCTNVPREQCRQVERQVPKQVEKEVSSFSSTQYNMVQ